MVGLCQHSPAIFYQVMHDFIQDLFKEGCADPEVLDGLRRQVGQLWHLAHILRDALDLISSLEVQGKRHHHHQLITEHWRSPGHSQHLVRHEARVSVVLTGLGDAQETAQGQGSGACSRHLFHPYSRRPTSAFEN